MNCGYDCQDNCETCELPDIAINGGLMKDKDKRLVEKWVDWEHGICIYDEIGKDFMISKKKLVGLCRKSEQMEQYIKGFCERCHKNWNVAQYLEEPYCDVVKCEFKKYGFWKE